jgi:DNA-binding transcriptional regulator GbsR (MarR family)
LDEIQKTELNTHGLSPEFSTPGPVEDVFIEAHTVVRHCIHHTQVKLRCAWSSRRCTHRYESALRKFILHWGEMGTRWGAIAPSPRCTLLYISAEPLNADDIIEALEVARSNVSTSLKELQGWGIVRLVHVQGDKRDHFESLKDVWDMFRIVMDERKKREFDPTIRMLRECIAEAERDKATDEYTEARLKELYGFFETTTTVYAQVRRWTPAAIIKFMKAGDKVLKALGLGA